MEKMKKAPRPEEVRARIKQLVQQTLQEALEAELEDFLGYPKNGKAHPTTPGTVIRRRPFAPTWARSTSASPATGKAISSPG